MKGMYPAFGYPVDEMNEGQLQRNPSFLITSQCRVKAGIVGENFHMEACGFIEGSTSGQALTKVKMLGT